MATFVLVHGTWHGGWWWRDVASVLAAAGHDVLTPTASGLVERRSLATSATLSVHVEELAGLVYFADPERTKDHAARCGYFDGFATLPVGR